MLWFKAARYPLRSINLQVLIRVANGITWPTLAYALICSAGFLAVVGIGFKSLFMAALPWLAPMAAGCVGLGYLWETMGRLMADPIDGDSRSKQTQLSEPVDMAHIITLGWQGIQLVIYLAFVGIGMSTLAGAFPYSIAVFSILTILGLPLALVPVAHASHERSLIAIVYALPTMGRLLNRHYGVFCTQLWLYTLVMAGIIYPVMMTLLAISIAGLVFIPGFILACGLGYARLLVTLVSNAQTAGAKDASGSALIPDARPYGFAPQPATAPASSHASHYRARRIQLRPTQGPDDTNNEQFNGSWPYRP